VRSVATAWAMTVLLLTLLLPAAATAQSVDRQADAAAEAAATFLGLAEQGQFNTLFDYLHPDAQAEVPRSVGLAVFQAIYGQSQPSNTEITGVDVGSWTWPVNGRTYDDAVQVSYRQQFTNGNGERQTLDSVMYLVPFDGQYRWFFGNSRAFIAEAWAKYAPVQREEQPVNTEELLRTVIADLDGYWAGVFRAEGTPYQTPGAILVRQGEAAQSACGLAQSGFWAFYCPADQTVYLDEPFLAELGRTYGDFAVAFVVGHEFAHHVQTVSGVERVGGGMFDQPDRFNEVYSIELELQADCLTGTWSRDIDTRQLLAADDLAEASAFIFTTLGDSAAIDPLDPQAHGTGEQRLDAFTDGYDGGIRGCEVLGGLSPVR
jgi:uncharacterized protein